MKSATNTCSICKGVNGTCWTGIITIGGAGAAPIFAIEVVIETTGC